MCASLGGDWFEVGYGHGGYRQSRRMGPLVISYDGANAGMGVHVRAPGDGCRYLESLTVGTAWPAFLDHVSTDSRSLSRLDVALDDREGRISVEQCVASVRAREAVSRWKKAQIIDGFGLQSGTTAGTTLHLGSVTSAAQMRIYDKAAQMGERGPWTRVELMLRDDRATVMGQRLSERGLAGAAPVIRSYLDFRPASKGRNRERHASAPWWSEFLGWVAAEPLGTSPSPPRTVELLGERLEAQYGPILGVITEVQGFETLVDMTDRARSRWRDEHRRIVAAG